jgi:glucuronoarabinoxylan endo-1,4-beta-xylanase
MKEKRKFHLRPTIILVLFFSFFSCSSDDKEVRKFILTVNDGSGSGEYDPGFVVTITANVAPAGNEFDRWTGDTSTILSSTEALTKITMPATAATISATFKAIDLGPPVSILIDKTTTYQTIDGFGFFGAHDVWWGSASNMWNDAWGEKVIGDLGITIWRNEYFPPATATVGQDADWAKQKPVVEGLKAKADKYNVDLKFVFTVWSPPADLKWQSSFTWPGDANATRQEGPVSTKNGGTLNPNKYAEFASWLKEGVALYNASGIDVYALSLQNELMFTQPFNSCTYTFSWYNDLLINVVPQIKTTYPDVKIFGAEHMLDMEGANTNWPYFYHSNVKANPLASANLDILAVHGYTDGVAPSSGSGLAERWTNHLEQFSKPMNKPSWMTETSGYLDTWLGSTAKPGALSLAQDIHAGLYYGNMSAWVWWQGSQTDGIGEYNLMNGTMVGKKYYASKHFYRYVRPGAVRIKGLTSNSDVYVTAYEHTANKTHTVIVINSGTTDKLVYLDGPNLPDSFTMYRTNDSTENCALIKSVSTGASNTFVLPAKSIVTLQAGGDPL